MSRPIPIEEMVEMFKRNHDDSHLFKIDNFSLLVKHEIERIESSVFELGDYKWKIIVTVVEDDYEDDYNVSIFLENQVPIDDDDLEYQVYVVSQLKPIWHPKSSVRMDFDASSTPAMRGIKKLMSVTELKRKGYLIEDCCMFGASLPDLCVPSPGTAECLSLIEKPLNNKVTWMMSKFSSFDPEKAHHSNEFVVGNGKWRIEVHPEGYDDEKGKSFSVYLKRDGFINNAPKTKTLAKYKLRVLDQVKRDHIEKTDTAWFDEKSDDTYGFIDFMPLSKLRKPYLVNDKLYVGVEFEVISVTKYC